SPDAVNLAKSVKEILITHGIAIKPFTSAIGIKEA
ncbi:LamB/YcsF family protein, partial [Proteus mirabilis]